VYKAQHNETVYAVKVLTGMEDLVSAAAALSLVDPLLHKFEQVRSCGGVLWCTVCTCLPSNRIGGWELHGQLATKHLMLSLP
jgi:hypothetical protein